MQRLLVDSLHQLCFQLENPFYQPRKYNHLTQISFFKNFIRLYWASSYFKMIWYPLQVSDWKLMATIVWRHGAVSNSGRREKALFFKARLSKLNWKLLFCFYLILTLICFVLLTINKSLSLWSARGFLIRSSHGAISHNTTWPFRQPPAITFGSVGEKAKEKMSSGASKSN